MNKVLIIIITILLMSITGCSKEDKYVGTWYDKDKISGEITKDKDGYKYRTLRQKEDGSIVKGEIYDNGYIEEEILLFDNKDRYIAFEYIKKNELMELTLWQPNGKLKPLPSECEREENWILTRGNQNEEK